MIEDIKGVLIKLAETENYCRSLEQELKEVTSSRDKVTKMIESWDKKDILLKNEQRVELLQEENSELKNLMEFLEIKSN